MGFIYRSDYEGVSEGAANHLYQTIKDNAFSVIGCASGNSTKLTYNKVAKLLANDSEAVENIQAIQLDEWVPLPAEHSHSCNFFLQNHIQKPWKLKPEQLISINGAAGDVQEEIETLRQRLYKTPLDICVLGIGENGHLALNEPGSNAHSQLRMVDLSSSSRQHSRLEDSGHEVQQGITIGLREILESKEIILIVTGENKKEAFSLLKQKVSVEDCPATAIYLHDNWTCYVDESCFK